MRTLIIAILSLGSLMAQGEAAPSPAAAAAPQPGDGQRTYTVERGTVILLSLSKGISTKTAAIGDRVYLETAFPVVQEGRVVIPAGSYVTGTVTSVKRAGRVKGKSELYLRFDSLILPNGSTRDFRASVGSLDGTSNENLDKTEGRISGEGNKSGDAVKVGEAAGWGTAIGGIAARSATGAGIGAAAGAAAGLVGVLMTRGPDAVLERGSTLEMVLDRNLRYAESELPPPGQAAGRASIVPDPQRQKNSGWLGSNRP